MTEQPMKHGVFQSWLEWMRIDPATIPDELIIN